MTPQKLLSKLLGLLPWLCSMQKDYEAGKLFPFPFKRVSVTLNAISQEVTVLYPVGFDFNDIISIRVVKVTPNVGNTLDVADSEDSGTGVRIHLNGSPNAAGTHKVLITFQKETI